MMNNVMRDFLSLLQKKTVAEFFAGIGLVRIGLECQGWSITFANDIDPQKYEMYRGHFDGAEAHFLLGDIHKIPVERVPRVTLATASFPCNDLSLAGGRKGLQGEHSSAFWGFINVLRQMACNKPPLILLENVTGFLSANKGEDFRGAMLALNDLGYSVDAFILDAVRFVPQSRQRLFIVGLLEPLFLMTDRYDSLLLQETDTRPKDVMRFILNHPEIRWCLRRLPPQPINNIRLEAILEDIPETAPHWWNSRRADYLLNQMSLRHREIANRMITGKEWAYGTVFRRMRNNKSMAELRTDGIAGCLRTPRGGSAKQILFKAGQGRYLVRLLTPREAARLMGVGDYTISVSSDQALFGFGDAVCVPVIEWIAKHYLNPIIDEIIQEHFSENFLQEAS